MIRYVTAWAAIGILIPMVLLLLDRFAGRIINSFPFGLLFLAWPTSFMMWMASPEGFGVLVVLSSIALNTVLYAVLGRLVWAFRH
jgi:hypothetical protein